MSLAPWRTPLSRALHRNRSRAYSRYPQMATVRPNGQPANRTVVFRTFLPETNYLTFVTDVRSEKIRDLAVNPAVEICWYFTQTREQFRLHGTIEAITQATATTTQQAIRQQAWEAMSAKGKQQFFWPHPGQPRATEGFEEVDIPVHPVDTFAVLVLDPTTVDHLELKGEPQNRYQYARQADGSWVMQAVNP
ncbi:MAG: Npun_F5749 family FMN-dependent PPOX-type flavoprotein [Cyanobacteria bacterium J06638_28]